jgi:hypothetical protein
MTKENPVVLIYKRTHTGDPDHRGIFGINTCMGSVRNWEFDAVIGVGGKRPWQGDEEIACKVNYVGTGAKKYSINPKDGHPYVIFDHFCLFDEKGELVETILEKLHKYMYEDANVRLVKSDSLPENMQLEIQEILKLAENALSSSGYENLPITEYSSTETTSTKETHSTNKDTKGCCR